MVNVIDSDLITKIEILKGVAEKAKKAEKCLNNELLAELETEYGALACEVYVRLTREDIRVLVDPWLAYNRFIYGDSCRPCDPIFWSHTDSIIALCNFIENETAISSV